MPCYDKKLEASRQDFYNDVYSTRDVDCVITTGELELLMREKEWDLSKPVAHENDPASTTPLAIPELLTHAGSSSGSYLQSLISYMQTTHPTPLSLSVKTVRNSDFEEHVLYHGDEAQGGNVVFR